MAAHRKAFPTPRGDGKSDPKGGVARLPDVVARRLWCTHTKARRSYCQKLCMGLSCGGAILAFSIDEFDASNDLGELI